jgi:mRNA-degrading endonuclease RelE of RelBE toxin-antitoxin system
MRPFQIIFNPISAAELARMPKELQLQILGEFRGLPQQVMQTELDEFGKLERAGRILHRFRVGDYRVYSSHSQPPYAQGFPVPLRIEAAGRRGVAAKPEVLGAHRGGQGDAVRA